MLQPWPIMWCHVWYTAFFLVCLTWIGPCGSRWMIGGLTWPARTPLVAVGFSSAPWPATTEEGLLHSWQRRWRRRPAAQRDLLRPPPLPAATLHLQSNYFEKLFLAASSVQPVFSCLQLIREASSLHLVYSIIEKARCLTFTGIYWQKKKM